MKIMAPEKPSNIVQFKWTPGDIRCLIDLYAKHREKFDTIQKMKVWDVIAQEITEIRGKTVTSEQCNGQFKGLKAMYKKIRDYNNTSGNNRKDWEYFDVMHEILWLRPEINPPATCSTNDTEVYQNPDYDFCDLIVEEVIPKTSKKRKISDTEDSRERRHKEKMAKTDQFLGLFQTLVEHVTAQKKPRE